MRLDPILYIDGYKVGHKFQYHQDTSIVFSNLTPRSNKRAITLPEFNDDEILWVGISAEVQIMLEDFQANFFNRDVEDVVAKYKRRMDMYLGPDSVDTQHIRDLHNLGYLPVLISALPEGSLVPCRVPVMTIVNTDERLYWIVNYLETYLSAVLWQMQTSATTAFQYRCLLEQYAELTGSPKEFALWQGHDFSFRGMAGVEAAARSGVGHLASFLGTDTLPAIDYIEEYFKDGLEIFVGGSVPASEHSVASTNILFLEEKYKDSPNPKLEAEKEFFKRYITEIYPSGVASYVSDTFDFFGVLTEIAPALKQEILDRKPNGLGLAKVVFRPDCYAEGTKVFTKSGWVDFKEVNQDTLVAQVLDDGSYEFVKPSKVTNEYYEGDMIHFFDQKGKVDFLVTPNHRMISKINGEEKVDLAEKLKVGHHYRRFERSASAKEMGKVLTNLQRLNIAFQADGSYCTDVSHKIRFSFAKQRKIDRLISLVTELKLPFVVYDLKDNRKEIHITIDSSCVSKNFEWIDTTNLSKQWCVDFIEELSYWDSCRRSDTRFKFDSTNKSVVDVVEIVAISAGYGVLISEYEDNRKDIFNNVYTCNILKDSSIGGQSFSKKVVSYKGRVYCVTVPTGRLLVKNNRATLVCGNSGDPVKILTGYKVLEVTATDPDEFDYEEDFHMQGIEAVKDGNQYFEIEYTYDRWKGYVNGYVHTRELTEAEVKGAVEVLWDEFGGDVTDKGYKLLNQRVGLIYGDSITLERAKEILQRLEAKGFASGNVVFGIGSFTYQHNTRDTHGFAIKSTYTIIDETEVKVYKDPKTDDGTKKSAKGLLHVFKDSEGKFILKDDLTYNEYNTEEGMELDQLKPVLYNQQVKQESFQDIRIRVNEAVEKKVRKVLDKS